jgi:hypothetical protein
MVMSRFRLLAAASTLLLLTGGCDTSFNPSVAFKPSMVVYCVLTTESDTQFVRIYPTYLPPDNDPAKNPAEISVTDAVVKVTGTNPLYDARICDFQLLDRKRADQSRYKSDIAAYYCFPFRPIRGATYRLTAVSPTYGTATAVTTVPGPASITPLNAIVLSDPLLHSRDDFGLTGTLAPKAKAFLGRIYVDYLFTLDDRNYFPRRFEVPLGRQVISCYWALFNETFPSPAPKESSEGKVSYSGQAYLNKLSFIYDREGASIRFTQAVFYLVQFDQPLWDYYAVANKFQDRFSVRIDEPDYTNIANGTGVFGSATVDSLSYPLPSVILHRPPGCY